jgi:hypothetical protein
VRRRNADADLQRDVRLGVLRLVRRRPELPRRLDLHLRRILRLAREQLPLKERRRIVARFVAPPR